MIFTGKEKTEKGKKGGKREAQWGGKLRKRKKVLINRKKGEEKCEPFSPDATSDEKEGGKSGSSQAADNERKGEN